MNRDIEDAVSKINNDVREHIQCSLSIVGESMLVYYIGCLLFYLLIAFLSIGSFLLLFLLSIASYGYISTLEYSFYNIYFSVNFIILFCIFPYCVGSYMEFCMKLYGEHSDYINSTIMEQIQLLRERIN